MIMWLKLGGNSKYQKVLGPLSGIAARISIYKDEIIIYTLILLVLLLLSSNI